MLHRWEVTETSHVAVVRVRLRIFDDPRCERNRKHIRANILTLAVCAVIGGANIWFVPIRHFRESMIVE